MNKKFIIMTAFASSAVLMQAALTTGTTYIGGNMTLDSGWDNNLPRSVLEHLAQIFEHKWP